MYIKAIQPRSTPHWPLAYCNLYYWSPHITPPYVYRPGRGGGRCLFEGSIRNKTTYPWSCTLTSLSHCASYIYRSCFLMYQRTPNCYYCYHCGWLQTDRIFHLSWTIKTTITTNPGCFPWTRQYNLYIPHREGPLWLPPFRDGPSFSTRKERGGGGRL